MTNGNRVTCIRIVLSAFISAEVVALAAWLINANHEIPPYWWLIGGLAIGGVVGVDVVTSYLQRGKSDEH